MATIHVQVVGDKVLLQRCELERLVELVNQSEPIDLQIQEDDLPTLELMRLAEEGGAFDFWREEGEAIYSTEDGEPVSLGHAVASPTGI